MPNDCTPLRTADQLLLSKLLKNVSPVGSCWLWTGARCQGKWGYGRLDVGGSQVRAHRLSWTLYLGPIPDGAQVLHSCDNPPCVNPSHLFLGTHADNMADMVAKGRQATGDRNGSRLHPERVARGGRQGASKLNDESVMDIRRLASTGVAQDVLAAVYQVTRANILAILKRKTWSHLPDHPDTGTYAPPSRPGGRARRNPAARHRKGERPIGSRHGMAKLTESDVVKIRSLHGDGVNNRRISEAFGVHRVTISYIVSGKTWRHVGAGPAQSVLAAARSARFEERP